MLLSLQRNNNNGSGAECPHLFGQGDTVGAGWSTLSCVALSRGQAVTFRRGRVRHVKLRRSWYVPTGYGALRRVMFWRSRCDKVGYGNSG